MARYLVDTHTLVWWLLEPKRLSKRATKLLSETENHRLYVSTLSLLELQYLIEIGRIQASFPEILSYLDSATRFALLPFDRPALIEAVKLQGTRDPFDRTILATGMGHEMAVITKDAWMHRNFPDQVCW